MTTPNTDALLPRQSALDFANAICGAWDNLEKDVPIFAAYYVAKELMRLADTRTPAPSVTSEELALFLFDIQHGATWELHHELQIQFRAYAQATLTAFHVTKKE